MWSQLVPHKFRNCTENLIEYLGTLLLLGDVIVVGLLDVVEGFIEILDYHVMLSEKWVMKVYFPVFEDQTQSCV
jgi:hypothetical protein